jgi:hypothetical protein
MALPTYYYSALMSEPLIILPRMGLLYLESDPGTAFFIHIRCMVGLINDTIKTQIGDIEIARRFAGHWAVICLHSERPPRSSTAFTVWGTDWATTLAQIHILQRLARTRMRRIRAHRANEIAKLKAFKARVAHVLPSDLIQLIVVKCLEAQRAPAHTRDRICRVETDSFRRLHRPH